MGQIVVGIAEGKIARGTDTLITYALGSCVGVCLYDGKNHVAGMAHILLPEEAGAAKGGNPYKFVDTGIRSLIDAMGRNGANRNMLTAKIAGGAEMFQHKYQTIGIGKKNVAAAKAVLAQAHIRVEAEDTGKNYGRTVVFSAKDGSMEVRTVNKKIVVL